MSKYLYEARVRNERVPIVVNTDLSPRTWKPATPQSRYEAECHPFIEVGSLPRGEYEKLERESVEDADPKERTR